MTSSLVILRWTNVFVLMTSSLMISGEERRKKNSFLFWRGNFKEISFLSLNLSSPPGSFTELSLFLTFVLLTVSRSYDGTIRSATATMPNENSFLIRKHKILLVWFLPFLEIMRSFFVILFVRLLSQSVEWREDSKRRPADP